MGQTITIYATNADIDPSGQSLVVTLEDVDVSEVIGEFATDEVLDTIGLETVKEYVKEHGDE